VTCVIDGQDVRLTSLCPSSARLASPWPQRTRSWSLIWDGVQEHLCPLREF